MIVFTVMLSSFAFYGWQIIYAPNILVDKNDQLFAIPKNTTFKELQNSLYDQNIVNDLVSFSFLAKLKKYDRLIKPGMYMLRKDMSNMEVINLLRSGSQTPITLTYTSARKLEELPAKIARSMAFTESEMAQLLLHDTTATWYGFDSLTFLSMFIPNSYQVYWTEEPHEILDRMKKEYNRYWNDDRVKKSKEIGLSQTEVSILASIVEGETNKMDEAPLIAGVYMNRLKRRIKLQADPTLIYATGDFTIRRVLNKHKEIESPYNTYKYYGLPPGPINMPSIAALDAVLNHKNHSFIYFCASADFSGYHVFASTLSEHNQNARKFQNALDLQQIFK
ncbi:MAG: endolytic transglycosylase MltG [Cyclobacteriaceae bacterium]|nr:endolytic transglycosylase MltG [Cyclobacteriaceae bacterium]